MRWEEMWDASLRIRNLIVKQDTSHEINKQILDALDEFPKNAKFAVRSSSSSEDNLEHSFAGIHDSFVDLDRNQVIEKVKLVWASLWSASAFLYSKELRYDLRSSKMAVIIQEFIKGDLSGVMFSRNPINSEQSIIELVSGDNQKFVDGKIEPYRWIFDRRSRNFTEHYKNKNSPEIEKKILPQLIRNSHKIERIFKSAQDIEWTFSDEKIFILQSRPITTGISKKISKRAAFDLTLRKPIENLRTLRDKIQKVLLPDFENEKQFLEKTRLNTLSNTELLSEIRRRARVLDKWEKIYWEIFIPFGHGTRIFAEFYNDIMKPEDPYEFLELLSENSSETHKRNNELFKLGKYLAKNLKTKSELEIDGKTKDEKFNQMLRDFNAKFSHSLHSTANDSYIVALAMKYSQAQKLQRKNKNEKKTLYRKFFSMLSPNSLDKAKELLSLAEMSYTMRDNDNLILLQLQKSLEEALYQAKKRLKNTIHNSKRIIKFLEQIENRPKFFLQKAKSSQILQKFEPQEKYIQIRGQPAGRGIATGAAKIIKGLRDIEEFFPGQVLVCDSIEPEINFIVPLAAAIVERRGGMLVHGAITAREYGIPCVTGIPNADTIISNGEIVTVDGYLGIVRIERKISKAP